MTFLTFLFTDLPYRQFVVVLKFDKVTGLATPEENEVGSYFNFCRVCLLFGFFFCIYCSHL